MEEKEMLERVGVPFYANFGETIYSFSLLTEGDSYFLYINHSSTYKLTDINLFFECFSLSGTVSLKTLLDKSILYKGKPERVEKDGMFRIYDRNLTCFVDENKTQQVVRKDFRVKGGLKYFLELPKESYDTGNMKFFKGWISTAKFTPKTDIAHIDSFTLFICPLGGSIAYSIVLYFQELNEEECIILPSFTINKCDPSEAINYMVSAITRNFNCSTRFEDYIHGGFQS